MRKSVLTTCGRKVILVQHEPAPPPPPGVDKKEARVATDKPSSSVPSTSSSSADNASSSTSALDQWCIFCLRTLQGDHPAANAKRRRLLNEWEEGPVPKAELNPDILKTFNRLLPSIHRDWKGKGQNLLGKGGADDGCFERLPSLCLACGDELQSLEEMMNAIQRKIRQLRELMLEGKLGGKCDQRWKEVKEMLLGDRRLTVKRVEAMLRFIDGFGRVEDGDEEKEDDDYNVDVGVKVEIEEDENEEDREENEIEMQMEDEEEIEMEVNDEIQIQEEDEEEDEDDEITVISDRPLNSQNVRPHQPSNSQNATTEIKMFRAASGVIRNYKIVFEPDKNKTNSTSCQVNELTTSASSSKSSNSQLKPQVHTITSSSSDEDDDEADAVLPLKLPVSRGSKPTVVIVSEDPAFGKGRIITTHSVTLPPSPPSPKTYTRTIDITTGTQQCDICTKKVPLKEILPHLRGHIGDYAVPCPNPQCVRAYAEPYKLEQFHLMKVQTCRRVCRPDCHCIINHQQRNCACDWEKVCETCGFKTSNTLEFKKHLREEHEKPSEKNFFCPVEGCGEGFTVKQSVHSHLAQRRLCGYQTCELCKKLVKKIDMKMHLETEHELKTEDVIGCRVCSAHFPNWEGLVQHLWDHRRIKDALTCYICNDGFTYSVLRILENHYYSQHQVGRVHNCDKCSQSFLNENSLKIHQMNTHLGKLAKPFPCTECQSSFSSAKCLEMHKRQKHLRKEQPKKKPAKIYTCDEPECGKEFKYKKTLDFHKMKEHASSKAGALLGFPCDVEGCNKSFRSLAILGKHKMTAHDAFGVQFFICEECGESFKDRSILESHRLIHTGERPFPCPYCGQRFRHTVSLNTHIRGHETKGANFKPKGPMENVKRRQRKK